MRRLLLTLILSLVSSLCSAHSCPRDLTLGKQFSESKRVFLAYVVETRLEEALQRTLIAKHTGDRSGEEAMKLVSAGYRVVEDFKGDKSYTPRLLDLLGIGTGYVGLTPGVYYLVFLANVSSDEVKGFRSVDACAVPVSHYRLDVPEFQSRLDEVRALSRERK
ncbi:hypothetical protein [Duganella sp. Root1480D1]|uniref:hypothetical protein n=1 Tax=Duganella sp. Root1480D1 TaxID=1736471 RepID=UPI00071114C0|nr:hypothetical protein [Duganella sp. Root1480D1]KQZ45035.1 hypothetical protein ASD58_01930 [Duganella sp. Root1480D1]